MQFAANEMSKIISFTVVGDTKVEANETFNVLLSSATNGATISDNLGIGTITTTMWRRRWRAPSDRQRGHHRR